MGTGEGSPPARRAITGRRRRRWLDGEEEEDDDEYVLEEEEEEEDCAEELRASSASEEGEDSDAEYQEEAEEEEEVETPRPKRLAKGSDRGRKGKVDPATARSRRRKYEDDEDYEEEVDEGDEVEYHDELEEVEEEEEVVPPRPKSVAKCGARGRNVKLSPGAKRSHKRKQEEGDEDRDFDPELDDAEDEDIDFDPDVNVKLSPAVKRSHKRKQEEEDEDIDFDPELDDEDDELDEDIDFDPDVDGDEEDEYQDEEEEELVSTRGRKVTVKNPVKRKSISKRQALKKKKKNRGSKVSRRKGASAKVKKSAPVRRRRKRSIIDDYEDEDVDEDDDDDFIVDDEVIVNRQPRKKARTGSGREAEVDPQVSIEEETWPDLESDTSDFEFATSDEEPNNVETPVVEPATVRKGRKKRISGSESSSDSEFVVSDKELEELREPEPPKAAPILPAPLRRICITRHGEGKGKEKQEPEEAGKPICGICLSEEQRATVQGVLNCCSHYFCFACIMEWSRVESRCPLCKQRFTTITKSSKVDLGLGVRKAVIKVEERDQVYQPTEEEIRRWLDPYENVVCIECNQGGDDSLMLLCDICDSSAHTYCVGLGREVPEGNWYCGGCRLGDEGPSYTGIQRTVAYERQTYRNHVDSSSVSFGMLASSGTFERPPSINPRHSFQGIDLNLSPREFPGESHPAESQVSTDSVSTPTGRRTVSARRQIHRYIRILLARPRQPSRPDVFHNIAQHSGGVPRTEPNRQNFPSSSEANTSHNLPDGIQNHHGSLPFVQAQNNFAPFMSLDGDDFQQIEGVKSNLRNM
ncbi:hypothetical protein BDA96_01G424700 [Sorghum bicolor]|uniref:PHD-type domain-containing protein n=2 Tax=Sorghum bicolor TaxID=4558 RepID=A0A1Z5S9X8_SORBI|nr:sarcoplasmic reticulum histidine-rich calcium-binding protein [Sorghum bicolor]XP_021310190.1 sarcoplasmic reticulum histidine-rich calcium-binding protein [Sorghum bicolor]XP_021310192.1 sarcoplasmic reticulum histidine-rich calcium-binding protein [Sorghum bicolor]KAG0551451.1 hypothetical protein BDA96_01G424700 [Sorghum bicolor]OQU92733.1 hypothetical protein SORBI_3001G398950 [Sorghum bicolor]|eukprot:XP_021310184.1 sarcoplasmic reticulum histidine-rich calcium-binding protein [Sorghum bicolor]